MKTPGGWISGLIAALALAQAAAAQESKCGTAIAFEASIEAAQARARKEGKLVLVLHVSGQFDDPALT